MLHSVVTVHTLIADATDRLRAAGLAAPRETALRLLAGRRGISLGELLLAFAEPTEATDGNWLRDAVGRHIAGEPLAYVIGTIGFRHLDLAIDRRALIPRPETESVVGAALAAIRQGVAADIGTGSGAIALSLRKEGHFDRVIGVDCSVNALALAAENGQRTGLSVEWSLGDLVGPLRDAGTRVDLLVSNPPYLTEAEYGSLEPGVRDFEPELALVSGADGMRDTARLLNEAPGVMNPGGWLVMELDCRRAAITAVLASQLGWQAVRVQDDLFGRARILLAQRGTQDD